MSVPPTTRLTFTHPTSPSPTPPHPRPPHLTPAHPPHPHRRRCSSASASCSRSCSPPTTSRTLIGQPPCHGRCSSASASCSRSCSPPTTSLTPCASRACCMASGHSSMCASALVQPRLAPPPRSPRPLIWKVRIRPSSNGAEKVGTAQAFDVIWVQRGAHTPAPPPPPITLAYPAAHCARMCRPSRAHTPPPIARGHMPPRRPATPLGRRQRLPP